MSSISNVTPTIALTILERQRYRCALTGQTLTPETAVLDHIVPLARGGAHCATNVWVIHKDVNRAKGQLLLDELYAMCEQAVANKSEAQRLQQLALAGWRKQSETPDTKEAVQR